MVVSAVDRVGLGWRPGLAAGIHLHLDEIDVLEVIADNYFKASKRDRQALRWLARQAPLCLHGVGMGLASTQTVEKARVEAMARLVGEVEPLAWSEHLAFVRANGIEIGHLAQPPRNDATIDGAMRNVNAASSVIGSRPLLENIATLVEPPGAAYAEPEWVGRACDACGSPLLLDLHNLYANAINARRDPMADLLRYPLHRVAMVHLSGGVMIRHPNGEERLLDDHLHDVPTAVLEMLTLLAQRTAQPLNVIIERDGHYPSFDTLRAQLAAARAALDRGRALQRERGAPTAAHVPRHRPAASNDDVRRTRAIEKALALAFTGSAAMINESDEPLRDIDRIGLDLAARSYERKRSARAL